MRWFAAVLLVLVFSMLFKGTSTAQTPAPSPAEGDVATLAKRIDELHLKIDALSQQLLKLQQQLEKPGRLIGETTPTAPPAPTAENSTAAAATASPGGPGGITHTVARGETLTAIAKNYKVTVEELQRHNQIDDGRKLQAGQTIAIPTGSGTSASPSSSPKASP